MIRLRLGDLRLTVLEAGHVWLDGGAMFGVVPKTLWARKRQPDAENRIRLAMNLLLIEDGERRILVDTGAGDKWSEKAAAIYRLEPRSAADILAPAGLAPDRIDVVINTHLHFDHAGGNTRLDAAGQTVAAFPNAEYVLQRTEYEVARRQNERIRASYPPENFEPLAREGRLRLVDGDLDLTPAVQLRPAPGHTPGMQLVLVRGGGRVVAFMADLVPTASHVPYPWIMGFDLEPLRSLESKKKWLPLAAEEGWWILFEHDDRLPLAVLESRDGKLEAVPVEVEV